MPDGRCWAVLPVKSFDWAKSRLEGALSAEERRRLARGLMLNTLAALTESEVFAAVLVVSRATEVLQLAAQQGARPLDETGAGLNEALRQARGVAVASGTGGLLVLASDLPLVQSGDIRGLMNTSPASPVVIAPDRRDEGTNALLLRPPGLIDFAFGVGSFEKHCRLARDAGVEPAIVRSQHLGWDVDLPSDLDGIQLPWWPQPERARPV
jgi:2-phospho-L-lactate/phosphoenolpyruvate guanylyltransferase